MPADLKAMSASELMARVRTHMTKVAHGRGFIHAPYSDDALEELARRLSELERENARLKGRIVVASDALTDDDDQEAYHQLYAAVDPDFKHADGSPFELWREHAERLLEPS